MSDLGRTSPPDAVSIVGQVIGGLAPLMVGFHDGEVVIGHPNLLSWDLNRDQVEEFAQLLVRASWEAARQDGAP